MMRPSSSASKEGRQISVISLRNFILQDGAVYNFRIAHGRRGVIEDLELSRRIM